MATVHVAVSGKLIASHVRVFVEQLLNVVRKEHDSLQVRRYDRSGTGRLI